VGGVCALCVGLLVDHFPVRVKCLELTGPQALYLFPSSDIAAVLLLFLLGTTGLCMCCSLTVKGRGSCRLPETVGRAVGSRAMGRVHIEETAQRFSPLEKDPRTGEERSRYLRTAVVYSGSSHLFRPLWSFRQKLERPQSSQSLSEPIKRRKVPLC